MFSDKHQNIIYFSFISLFSDKHIISNHFKMFANKYALKILIFCKIQQKTMFGAKQRLKNQFK